MYCKCVCILRLTIDILRYRNFLTKTEVCLRYTIHVLYTYQIRNSYRDKSIFEIL